MDPSVNLLIACYGGRRRAHDPAYDADPARHLKVQMDSLARYRHECQVTIISNGGPEEYLEFLRSMPHRVIERENKGMSYAAWTAGYDAFPNFDYYIVIEDDYAFVRDGFDALMVEQFEYFRQLDSATAYVCQLIAEDTYPWPLSMNGITAKTVLQQLGGFGWHEGYDQDYSVGSGQRGWGNAIKRIRGRMFDMSHRFKVPFNEYGHVRWYRDEATELLLVPTQIYEEVTGWQTPSTSGC